MLNFIKDNKILIISFASMILITLASVGFAIYLYCDKDVTEAETQVVSNELSHEEESKDTFYMEVKGAVKTPGVYEVTSKNIINDVIALAGGFTKTAYTNNINLSKKVANEMVIYVYTKTEYKKLSVTETTNECTTSTYEINNCTDNGSSIVVSGNTDTNFNKEDSTSNGLVNINTATVAELTTVSGIGEAKANNIIQYRTEKGLFNSIEDIKNVSGIGDALYEQIKAFITV